MTKERFYSSCTLMGWKREDAELWVCGIHQDQTIMPHWPKGFRYSTFVIVFVSCTEIVITVKSNGFYGVRGSIPGRGVAEQLHAPRLRIIHYSLFSIHCSLFIVHLFIVHCSLFIIHYSFVQSLILITWLSWRLSVRILPIFTLQGIIRASDPDLHLIRWYGARLTLSAS